MNLTSIVKAVTAELRRPDLEATVMRAVRSTVTQVHTVMQFAQDLSEDTINLPEALQEVKFNIPPRFRKFHTIRPLTPSGMPMALPGTRGTYSSIAIDDVMTAGGAARTNGYYVAGSAVVLRSGVPVSKLYVSYYQTPDISNPLLETWAMAMNAELFITGALAKVYDSPLRQAEIARATATQFATMLQQFAIDQGGA